MSRGSVHEYAAAIRDRYGRADRAERKRILDEFVSASGYHRKSAIRLLNAAPEGRREAGGASVRGRPRQYRGEAVSALRRVWESADWICSRRLQPFMPKLLTSLRRHGELILAPEIEAKLCAMSSATMDRVMKPFRHHQVRRGLSTTKPGTLLKELIPVRTFADWNEQRPGFLEVDLVAHCGESTAGFYLCTLNATDIHTGWTECVAVWGKGKERVGGAIHTVRKRLPFPMLGLDADNGGEFINHVLYDYCQRHRVTFTRCRSYKKNDQAHVEQKNWTVVRRLVGYDRYHSKAALAALNELYEALRLYVNFFQPVLKLVSKEREGAKVRKRYDVAQTPFERLCASGILDKVQQEGLERLYQRLNPVRLRKEIDQALERLWKLAAQEIREEQDAKQSKQRAAAGG